MNDQEEDRLIPLFNDPPAGSKLAAAKEYGIDLTLFLRTLGMTPTERLEQLAAAQSFVEEFRRARKKAG